MYNIERYKDILEDLFTKDYLYRNSYDEWYRLKEYQKEIEEYIKKIFGYTLSTSNDVISLNKYSVLGDKSKGIKDFSDLDEYIILPSPVGKYATPTTIGTAAVALGLFAVAAIALGSSGATPDNLEPPTNGF